MKNPLLKLLTISIFVMPLSTVFAASPAVNKLMQSYQSQGAVIGNAQTGEKLWSKTYVGKAPFTSRSCKTCHTTNLKDSGEHVRTGKNLKPLAPSANSKSLTSEKKIKKWFKRNCKWTVGRECNAQEKSDILSFILQQ